MKWLAGYTDSKQGFTCIRLAFTDSALIWLVRQCCFESKSFNWTLSSIFDKHGVTILFVYCLLQVVKCILHTLLLLDTLFEEWLIILRDVNSNLRNFLETD